VGLHGPEGRRFASRITLYVGSIVTPMGPRVKARVGAPHKDICDPAGIRGNLSVLVRKGLTLRVLYQGTPSGVPDGSLTE
jgi:hypothetical protein